MSNRVTDEREFPTATRRPKESFPELVVPNAIPVDERLWVPQAENVWFRPLCLSASRGYWMNLLRVRRKSRRAFAPSSSSASPRLCAQRQLALSGA